MESDSTPTRGRGDGQRPGLSELVVAARNGDRDARERLGAALREEVVTLVRAKLGKELRVGANVESEDVAHDVLAKIAKALPTLDKSSDYAINGWIRLLVVNRIRDLHESTFGTRKRNPRATFSIDALRGDDRDDDPHADRSLPDPKAQSPLQVVIDRELSALAVRAIERIPRDLAEIVRAIEFDRVSFVDYGKAKEMSPSNVRFLHARGLALLAMQIGEAIGAESRRNS